MNLYRQIFLSAAISMAAGTQAWSQDNCSRTVTIQPGETLSSIAKREYGTAGRYHRIISATNAQASVDSRYPNINNPNSIKPGWLLCLPDLMPASPVQSPVAPIQTSGPSAKITFLQINDVYEMTPVGGAGGVARLATLQKQLEAENPNTYSVLSGDLFSPSALGTAKVDGERLAGKQMVAAMNAFGLDFATFGNHEFDIKEEQFRKRMEETETSWFTSNVFEKDGTLFPKTSSNLSFSVTDSAGEDVNIAMFGVTLDSNPVSYVSYTDPFEATQNQINALGEYADILIAVTHLSMEQDKELARRFPQIDLVIGGHEHENAIEYVGDTPVTKADANARTAYILDMTYYSDNDRLEIKPTLKVIDASIPDDPAVAQVVNNWLDKAFAGFKEQGFEPTKAVATITDELDGTEASVRNRPTLLTKMIADSMKKNAPGAEAAFFNGGSIRIDDTILPGEITEYDVIRILPFGGSIMSAEMQGALLIKTLDQGAANSGIGGYLQTSGITGTSGAWQIAGAPIDPGKIYKIAVNDFLLTGKEQNLEFLKEGASGLTVLDSHDDLRVALISELKAKYNAP